MATYSVYDYTRKVYDYYEGSGPGGAHAGAPLVGSLGGIGATPEQAAWSLPAGARKVGSGELPKGRIASLGGLETQPAIVKLGLAALAAYAAWKVWIR